MMERWFFTMGDRNVVMRAPFETDDGTAGDTCRAGEMIIGKPSRLQRADNRGSGELTLATLHVEVRGA